MTDNKRQTTRPFGVSLAIVVSLILFSFIPLLQVFFTLYIRTQMGDSGMQIGGSGDAIGGALGIASITNVQLLLRGVPALLYVGVAVMAWRGRPPVARYVMSGAVVVLWLYGDGLTADCESARLARRGGCLRMVCCGGYRASTSSFRRWWWCMWCGT